MKRLLILIAILIAAVAVYAHSTITLDPADFKEGETKTFNDGDKTISVTRNGDTMNIKIQGAGETKNLSITRDGRDVRISRDGQQFRTFRVPNADGRQRIIINGDRPIHMPRGHANTWYICPKDNTTLRVPDGKDDAEYKCPVDGTKMEKHKGRGYMFLLDGKDFDFDWDN